MKSFSRPRSGSFPGCDAPNKYLAPPPLNGDFANKARPKLSIFVNEEKKDGIMPIDDAIKLDEDSDDLDEERDEKVQESEDVDTQRGAPLERFRIEDYEHLTPSLIKVIEAFLDLEKRSTLGGGLTLAATSMMSWFFNGYIANKLYNQTAAQLTMDGTLSYLAEWVSDLLWIPPAYEMKEEVAATPTNEEMDRLRIEARECIQKLFEVYIGDNVPKIIGQKKQLMLCVNKFWRFMQQKRLLKHLAFSVLDALLQDLFPERVSRRYQRRAWMAEKVRKKEETKRKMEEKERKQREKEKVKRLKQQQKINQQRRDQQKQQQQQEPILAKISNGHRSDPMALSKEDIENLLRRVQSQEAVSPLTVSHRQSPSKAKLKRMSDQKERVRTSKGQILNPHHQIKKSKTRPLVNTDSAPSIDLFSGGSLFSDYTKRFMGIGKKTKEENDDSTEYESSSDNEDESESVEFEAQSDWNHKSHLAQNGLNGFGTGRYSKYLL